MRSATEEEGSPEAGLRADLGRIVRRALVAVDPERLVLDALRGGPAGVGEGKPVEPGPGKLVLVSVGKAAVPMARGAVRALGADAVVEGVVLRPGPPAEFDHPRVEVLVGGHPLPDVGGVRAARRIAGMVRGAGEGRTVLLLLSGGASALLSLPAHGVSLEDLRAVTRDLLRAGAPIEELNTVRKHLEELKGGALARQAGKARVVALVLSDVVGDRLDVIGSGPVSPDPTTFSDAVAVLRSRGLQGSLPPPVRRRLEEGLRGRVLETPGPGDPCFRRVSVRVLASIRTAVRAAAGEARASGYDVRVLSTRLTGEARLAGVRLGRLALRVARGRGPVALPGAIITGGETTVTVRGEGRGGPNQEVALGAAGTIAGRAGVLVASVGTDGVDGPTDAAGALVTGSTLERARAAGLDPGAALERNDAHPFFEALGDLVVTGPTGTNVMDLQVILVRG